jgi:endonuclease VIII
VPEGHTVHRIAGLFRDVFLGEKIFASSPQGRFREGAKLISGSVLERAEARGKQLFLHFEAQRIVRVHLGIYGAWDVTTLQGESVRAGSAQTLSLGAPRATRRRLGESEASWDADEPFPPAPRGAVRLRLETVDVVADLRGPTACEVHTPQEVAAVLARLGPDPLLDKGVRGQREFVRRALATSRPLGVVLMDQAVLSGIGNVYRAEILFRHQLDPYRPASSVPEELLVDVWKDWSALLADGVKTGVMLTRNDLDAAGRKRALRVARERYFVYKREGLPCRVCGTHVQMALMATRKLYFCPECQLSRKDSS